MVQHGNEGRTAGCGHDPAFLPGIDPFHSLVSSGHIPAKSHLHHIRKAGLFQRCPDGGHTDLPAELSFGCRGTHGEDTLPVEDRLYHLGGVNL